MANVLFILQLGVRESFVLTAHQEKALECSYGMEKSDMVPPPIGYFVSDFPGDDDSRFHSVELQVVKGKYDMEMDLWSVELKRHLCESPDQLVNIKKGLEEGGWKPLG
jgi:hypothetical protein